MSYRMYRTKAYVLRRWNRDESSVLVSLYTEEFGHIQAHAQGIRESYSKLRSSLQMFALISVELVRGKKMWRITNAIIDTYPWNPGSYQSHVSPLIARTFSLLERLTPGEESNPEIFRVCGTLYSLANNKEISVEIKDSLEILVVLRILAYLGYVDAEKYKTYIYSDNDLVLVSDIQKEKRNLVSVINEGLRESHL